MHAPQWLREQLTRIEAMRALDPVADGIRTSTASLASGAAGDALRGKWLGHALHPLMTDLPLGCWTAAGLLDLTGGRQSRRAAQRLVGLGLLFVPATAASGLVDLGDERDERVQRVGVVHGVGNTIVALLYVASWRRRRRGDHLRGVVLGMAGGLLAVVTGYLGGHMSFARSAGVGERGLHRDGPAGGDLDGSANATPTFAGFEDVRG